MKGTGLNPMNVFSLTRQVSWFRTKHKRPFTILSPLLLFSLRGIKGGRPEACMKLMIFSSGRLYVSPAHERSATHSRSASQVPVASCVGVN